ncbi:NAD(P)/FAD-dependent oxidoreductase [Streptomyces sp. SID8352]|uniref:flavin-containing monooxygenase n=1 Tax=Streptomyces sp. SID8352 TaxID=2690338 RepID=UPI0013703ACA|nr:NAD(P)/FAD-dependent oxidoreductase [Streptomyces sp. SID8352]MYU22647.1 NAD(P)-binding domain-containing protein [Streptomyces sp. SID8352]
MTEPRPVNPVTAGDDEIREALLEADLPALLPALAHLTGDPALIADRFRPAPPSPVADLLPQGGMSPESQAAARELALRALRQYRDAGSPPPGPLSPEEQRTLVRFVTGDLPDDYLPLLNHELGLTGDAGAPDWHKDELAPDREFSVAVIGAGMSGIAAAHRLDQAGVPYVVLEKSEDVGGTWWANRYPGCRLDTSNFAYSYSFAQKADWQNQFSPRDEIFDYFDEVVDEFAIRPRIRFGTEVVSAHFDEGTAAWELTCESTDGSRSVVRADAVISAVGQLNRPSYPDIPGRSRFRGLAFHTAQWPDGADLAGLRVAVIGTGASAYQVIPAIAPEVGELRVFQRTAPWMMPTPSYHDKLPDGMRWLLRHVPNYHRWFRFMQFWNSLEARRQFMVIDPDWTSERSVSRLNEAVRRALHSHLEGQYADRPDLLARVVPDYPPYTKRMLRDNGDWARTLKSKHVHLITEGVEEITEKGIVTADGVEHEVDVIIYGTGFLAAHFLEPMKITGRGGVDLHEQWAGDPRAYLGITIPGFPNLFCLYGPNTNLVLNGSIILFSEAGVHYTIGCIQELMRRGAGSMECRQDVFESYNSRIDEANQSMAWSTPGVNSWYKNASGRVTQNWPLPIIEYWRLTRRPDPADYHFGQDVPDA